MKKEDLIRKLTAMGMAGQETTVNIDGQSFPVFVAGNDNCWDSDEFWQYGVAEDGTVYKMFYSIPDGMEDLSGVDYSAPYKCTDVTGEVSSAVEADEDWH